MARNTLFLVCILALFAAVLVGVNIGKRMTKQASPAIPVQTPTPSPGTLMQTYMDTYCGFSLIYPASFTVLENASGSAILHNTADKTQSITLTCQTGIPRPPLSGDKIEPLSLRTATGASVSATLYHDSSASTGTPIDTVIFRHPTNGMDGFIAGYGTAFDAAIKTLQIFP
jgi:hypothetical protein